MNLVVLHDGTLLVADYSKAIIRVDVKSGDRTIVSGRDVGAGPDFVGPFDITVDGKGNIYVADADLKSVIRVHPQSGDRSIVSSAHVGSGP